jgi:Lon protease-like protein
MNKMSQHIIPMFPLNTIVFPKEDLQLFIFEPRYKQLINEAKQKGLVFGIPFVKNGKTSKYGTLVMLKKILNETCSGEMNIVVQGLNIFKIDEFLKKSPEKLYPGAVLNENFPTEIGVDNVIKSKANLVYTIYFEEIFEGDETSEKDNLKDSFDLANSLQMPLDQKYKLISVPNENARLRMLYEYMLVLNASLKSEKALEKRFILN